MFSQLFRCLRQLQTNLSRDDGIEQGQLCFGHLLPNKCTCNRLHNDYHYCYVTRVFLSTVNNTTHQYTDMLFMDAQHAVNYDIII